MIGKFDKSEFFRMLEGRLDERTSRLVAAAAAGAVSKVEFSQQIADRDVTGAESLLRKRGRQLMAYSSCIGMTPQHVSTAQSESFSYLFTTH